MEAKVKRMFRWLKRLLKWLLNWDCFEIPTMSKREVIKKLEENIAITGDPGLIELYENCLFYLKRIPILYYLKKKRRR